MTLGFVTIDFRVLNYSVIHFYRREILVFTVFNRVESVDKYEPRLFLKKSYSTIALKTTDNRNHFNRIISIKKKHETIRCEVRQYWLISYSCFYKVFLHRIAIIANLKISSKVYLNHGNKILVQYIGD